MEGGGTYLDVHVGSRPAPAAAWCYPTPTPGFAALADHAALYPRSMEACFVDGERVAPQPGCFYGGLITSSVAGPFKGTPGSMGW